MLKSCRIEDVLDYKSGSSLLTQAYMKSHPGVYPVYSAKTIGETTVGTIDSFAFDAEGLQLTTNGANAGTWIYREKHKFSLNGDARFYYLREDVKELVSIKYLYFALKSAFRKHGFDWNKKATLNNVKNIQFKIPVDVNNVYDLDKQKTLATRYEEIEKQRQSLLNKIDEIKEMSVRLPENTNIKWAHPLVADLFHPRSGNMLYSKTFAAAHVGEIPLYSGTTTSEYARIDIADYEGEYLTWCIDGLAGYIMYHNEAFSITCHRGVLLPTKQCKNVDLKYIKYVLEPVFRKRKKGREGDLGKNEYTSLKPIAIKRMKDTIPIPIRDDGSYDIEMQKNLAEKYDQIEEIKTKLVNKIQELTEVLVI